LGEALTGFSTRYLIMNYGCKNNCHFGNKEGRCPRCGEWLLEMGKTTEEEIREQVKQRQMAYRKDVGRSERMNIKELQDRKAYLDRQEALYHNQFRK
jgi:hypothetical protein